MNPQNKIKKPNAHENTLTNSQHKKRPTKKPSNTHTYIHMPIQMLKYFYKIQKMQNEINPSSN